MLSVLILHEASAAGVRKERVAGSDTSNLERIHKQMELDIVRAWKDDVYRQGLTAEEQALVPENPIGEFELSDTDLEMICGGGACHHSSGDGGRGANRVYNNTIYTNNSFAMLCVQSIAILGACSV